jgi:hypothetical protein
VTPSAEPSAHRRVVLVLAVRQTVGYGVLLYAVPVCSCCRSRARPVSRPVPTYAW